MNLAGRLKVCDLFTVKFDEESCDMLAEEETIKCGFDVVEAAAPSFFEELLTSCWLLLIFCKGGATPPFYYCILNTLLLKGENSEKTIVFELISMLLEEICAGAVDVRTFSVSLYINSLTN